MLVQKKRSIFAGLVIAGSCWALAGNSLADPAAAVPAAAEKAAPVLNNETASYGIGSRIGASLKSQNIPVVLKSLIAGIEDSLAGKPSKFNDKEIEDAMTALQASLEKNMADLAKKNKEDGEKFLASNKTAKDIKVTEKGVQYKILSEGKGDSPKDDSTVKVHYRGTLLDGKEFDSSYKRNAPAEFTVNGVIPGWTEALKLMKPGAKWELTIPSDLAYGSRGTPGIPPNSVLKFTVELLEVLKKEEPKKVEPKVESKKEPVKK